VPHLIKNIKKEWLKNTQKFKEDQPKKMMRNKRIPQLKVTKEI
jgi:hypothetical protein